MAEDLLHETQVTSVVELLHAVVTEVSENSTEAVGWCFCFISSTSGSSRTIHKTKVTGGVEHEKVCPKILVFFEVVSGLRK